MSHLIREKIFNYFQIAAMTARSKADERTFFLGAVGIRKDGAMVKALNGPTQIPNRLAHAEARLCRKLDVGSVVYVARVSVSTGQFAISKPCNSCVKIMKSKGVKKVYYTIGPDHYGVMELN